MAAVVLDVTWLVLLIVAVAVLFLTHTRTLAGFIAAWGGSGAAAGLLLFAQHRVREVRCTLAWLRYTWGFSWRYVISYLSTQGAALGTSSGVGAIAGARALGGVQGALLLVRPFMTFQVAAIAASIGETTRARGQADVLRRHVIRTTMVATGAALVNVVVMLTLSDRLGEVVLGASWHVAQPLLWPAGVQIVLMGLITGCRAGLLGMRAIRKAMAVDVAGAVMLLIASISGAAVNGALGALWFSAAGLGIQTVLWWVVLLRHLGDPVPGVSVDPVPGVSVDPVPSVTVASGGAMASAPAQSPPAVSI